MLVETVKMSSKGQIVIPQDIRNELRATEGTIFSVVSSGDTLVMKKLKMPSREDLIKQLETIARKGAIRARNLGIKESDVPDLVHKLRRTK